MRIAALAPNSLIEVPPDTEAEEAKRVSAAVRQLKVVEAPKPGPDESLEDETRAGLQRLTELIRRKKREKDDESQQEASGHDDANDPAAREQEASSGAPGFSRIHVEDLPLVDITKLRPRAGDTPDAEFKARVISAYAKIYFYTDPQNIRGISLDKFK